MVVHKVTQGTGKTEYSTAVDPLTSLPNRLAFEADAKGLREYGQQEIGLTLIDISHFKHLNETLGFAAGDKILMALAARIKQSALASDRVYRAGNDQFLVMGRGGAEEMNLRRMALIDMTAQPMMVDDTSYVLQFHMGTHVSEQPETAGEALARAERALLLAKTHRTSMVHYAPAMGKSNYDPRLTKEIQDALSLGQFELFFQPQVDALDGLALAWFPLIAFCLLPKKPGLLKTSIAM
jgi:diguanylate cyclase (GGDEF)-like protein